MKGKAIKLLILLFTLTLIPSILAFELKVGGDVYIPSDTTIDDDFYVTGGKIIHGGTVNGDLVAAGGDIDLSGKTTEDLIVVGGNIEISGIIGDDLRAAGGKIELDGYVQDDVFIAGGQIVLSSDSKIEGNLIITGGQVRTESIVKENVSISAGRVKLGGKISGDVTVNGGTVKILPNTVIEGNLNCTSSKEIEIPASATIEGEFNQRVVRRFFRFPREFKLRSKIVSSMRKYFMPLFVGIVLILLLEKTLLDISQRIIDRPLTSFVLGFLFLIFTPIMCIFLIITIIGIPVGIILFFFYLITLYLSKIFVSVVIGEKILGKSKKKFGLIVKFAFGLLVWLTLRLLPLIGFLWDIMTILFGSGAVISVFRKRNRKKGI